MSVEIQQLYIQTFETILRHLAQQSETKLRGFVMERATNGNQHNWERLGAATADVKAYHTNGTDNTGLIETPRQDMAWSRRISIAQTYHAGEITEQEDPVQMLIDPNSNIAMSLGMAMKRQIDDVIIVAATGDAVTGGQPQAPNGSISFPAEQIVGDGTAPISFDLVTQVQEKFMQNDIPPDVPKVLVVGPTQIRKLMQLTEQTSTDYVKRGLDQLSSTGIVPNWMGFTWIMSTRLGLTVNVRECLAFTNRAIGLQVNKDITARIAEDPSFSFVWRIYCSMTMAAVRVEDEQIIHLRVDDSV